MSLQNEANTKELSAYGAVIKCIEEQKLELHFSPDPLQKRVAQLEKAKADRKRSAGAVKSQPKRPRANGGNAGVYMSPLSGSERTPALYASSNPADRSFYRSLDRVQYSGAAPGVTSYNLKGQSAYDRSAYGAAYGVGNRSPVSLSRPYMYPSDNMGPSLLGSGSYNSSTNYNNHHFGSGLPPPPPAYQSSFIH